MVQAMIQINDQTNRVLNIVKAKYGLHTKSEAIDLVVEQYKEELLEPELRPEFIKELEQVKKHGKFIEVKDIDKYFKELVKG